VNSRDAGDDIARREGRAQVEGRSGPDPEPVAGKAGPPASDRGAPGVAGQGGPPVPIARYVDHTLLRANATSAEIVKLCREARQHSFAAVCVNPVWVELAAAELAGSDVAVATVIGFPLGASTTEVKVFEARDAIARGATELDMVAQIGLIKEGAWSAVEADIRAVVEAAAGRALVKVILETAALEPMEIVKAATLCREAGAHFVKTSTGFHPAGGATPEAVALLRLAVGPDLGVKASGGIRTCEDALRMIAAGATRIGTSSGMELVNCYGHLAPPIDDAVRGLSFRAPAPPVQS
jgi:deoxyribose-phosphate aldolase